MRFTSRKTLLWILALAVAGGTGTFFWLRAHNWRARSVTIQGAVIRRDSDPHRQLPIADAQITASDGKTSATARSDASGYFKIVLGAGLWPQSIVRLNVDHPDYLPYTLSFQLGLPRAPARIFVAALTPLIEQTSLEVSPQVAPASSSVVSNIRVRYTTNIQTDTNIGSAIKTFEVVNQSGVPCNHQSPCSPNGHWKASSGSVTLEAGAGNVFRNVRASCIAGPCPFTRIDSTGFANGGPTITATALNWSSTATFLLEAEVFRDSISSSVRESYPVIFGRTLHFTLPPTQEGVSIDADLDGTPMVFPLGPALYLSWATCTARTGDKSTVYQCELKPNYRF